MTMLPTMLGESELFLQAVEAISELAELDRPLLIIGERGTGKELFASRAHYLSPRWDGPFVKMNCAALGDELLDAELFGYVPGAFTGAQKTRTGRFELADGGSIFLDELATMSARLQEKLLRVIEYGEFERLGSSETRQVSVRVVAATNEDLPRLASEGRFRADLLDRLSFDVLTLPPLRARPDDILLLAEKFAMDMLREIGGEQFAGFSERARRELLTHPWPGNVRELRNAIERSVYRQKSIEKPLERLILDPFDSPFRPRPQSNSKTEASPWPQRYPYDFRDELQRIERQMTLDALRAHHFHQGETAQALHLTYDQLRSLIRKYKLNKLAPEANEFPTKD